MSGLLDELRQAVPGDAVLTDRDLLRTYEHDEADLCGHGTPLAVVRPRHTADVAAVLRLAAAHRVPVVPQGARTGLAGAANAVDGAIILSLIGMNEIVEIDAAERVAVVQPGVTRTTSSARSTTTDSSAPFHPQLGLGDHNVRVPATARSGPAWSRSASCGDTR